DSGREEGSSGRRWPGRHGRDVLSIRETQDGNNTNGPVGIRQPGRLCLLAQGKPSGLPDPPGLTTFAKATVVRRSFTRRRKAWPAAEFQCSLRSKPMTTMIGTALPFLSRAGVKSHCRAAFIAS